MKSKIIRNYFSLVELLAVMAVFSILILVVFQFFSTAQNTWTITDAKRSMFEDARIALDLISRDIQSAYYGGGVAPFWHWNGGQPASWGEYRNELLAFVADTPIPPNSQCISTLCEIKYQLYYATTHSDENEGWVRRSVTGSNNSDGTNNKKWNYINNFRVGFTTTNDAKGIPIAAFTANSTSSGDYQKLIPYVLDLSFICDTDTDTSAIINPDTTTSTSSSGWVLNPTTPPGFPVVVTVSLTMLDKGSWQKWVSLCGSNVYHAPSYTGEPAAAQTFRIKHQVTFTKMVYLGNRGQE